MGVITFCSYVILYKENYIQGKQSKIIFKLIEIYVERKKKLSFLCWRKQKKTDKLTNFALILCMSVYVKDRAILEYDDNRARALISRIIFKYFRTLSIKSFHHTKWTHMTITIIILLNFIPPTVYTQIL